MDTGPSATPPSPRSSATPSSSPTSTTCGATSRFDTRVASAEWNDDTHRWMIHTDTGDDITCRYYVMATGCLSMPKVPDIEGTDRFAGEVYFTSTWPHDGVDFTGKRVAVIGTGSSAVQSIPLIAERGRAAHRVPTDPQLLDPGAQRPHLRRAPGARSSPTRTPTARRPATLLPACPARRRWREPSWCPTRNAPLATRRCGRPANCWGSRGRSATRSPTPSRTTRCARSSTTRSARS